MAEITTIDLCLYWSLLVLLLVDLFFAFRYLFSAVWGSKHPQLLPEDELPGVSIIVSAHNEAENLRTYLQALISQNYPTYEVIVVNNESQDATREVIESFMHLDSRIRMSFVPEGTHGFYPRKMALTLGAKAARYDILLFAEADTRPESNQWIASFVSAMSAPGIEAVVGPTACYPEHRFLARVIRYDAALSQLHTLGRVADGARFDGSLRNVAYRKELFFRMLQHPKVFNRHNTVALCTPEATVWREAEPSLNLWLQHKRGEHTYLFVRILFALLLLAIVLLSALRILSWWTGLLALGLGLLRVLVFFIALGRNTARLHWKAFDLRVLFYDTFLPFFGLYSSGRRVTGY